MSDYKTVAFGNSSPSAVFLPFVKTTPIFLSLQHGDALYELSCGEWLSPEWLNRRRAARWRPFTKASDTRDNNSWTGDNTRSDRLGPTRRIDRRLNDVVYRRSGRVRRWRHGTGRRKSGGDIWCVCVSIGAKRGVRIAKLSAPSTDGRPIPETESTSKY